MGVDLHCPRHHRLALGIDGLRLGGELGGLDDLSVFHRDICLIPFDLLDRVKDKTVLDQTF
jgi:hypothetical protein